MKKLVLIGIFVFQYLISPSGQLSRGRIDNPTAVLHCPIIEWGDVSNVFKTIELNGEKIPATLSLCKNPYYKDYIVKVALADSTFFVVPADETNSFNDTFSEENAVSFIRNPDFSGKKALIVQTM